MIVYISEEYINMSNELCRRGHQIVNSIEDEKCDVIICDLKNGELVRIIHKENSLKINGKLIIDIGSKSIDDIEYILNNRIYNYIFYYIKLNFNIISST